VADELRQEISSLIPRLRGYAYLLTRSRADADDLVQDALLKAWRFRSRYCPGTSARAWLFHILRNEFLTRSSRRELLTEDIDGAHAAKLSTPPDQETRLHYRDVMAGLDGLSGETRDALLLTIAGLSYAETARLCACPVGTIKSRINRARDSLERHDLRTTAWPESQKRAANISRARTVLSPGGTASISTAPESIR